MRMIVAAAVVAIFCSASAEASPPQACSDRNALNGVSVDARLVAIKYYFVGLGLGLADPKQRACYKSQVVGNSSLVVANKTLALIEHDCMSIESAARIAVKAACP